MGTLLHVQKRFKAQANSFCSCSPLSVTEKRYNLSQSIRCFGFFIQRFALILSHSAFGTSIMFHETDINKNPFHRFTLLPFKARVHSEISITTGIFRLHPRNDTIQIRNNYVDSSFTILPLLSARNDWSEKGVGGI